MILTKDLKPKRKTEVTTFHLSNKLATRKIIFLFRDEDVNYNCTPLSIYYVGSIFNLLITRTKRKKLKARLNIIQNLAGSTFLAFLYNKRTQ